MSNSDSDAFESADDEFQEQKTKKGIFIRIYFLFL